MSLPRFSGHQREVGAFVLSDRYRKVFQITRLADFMTMYDSEPAPAVAD